MSWPFDRGSGSISGPLYPRLLRLKHLHPSAWQRAVFFEGSVAVGSVAALADQVSAWTPVVLPVAVAAVVKFHDVLTGVLRPSAPAPQQDAHLAGAPAAEEPPRVRVADEPPAPVEPHRLIPGPLLARSAVRVRAELDALADAALEESLAELSRHGGMEPFVMCLDEGGQARRVASADVLALVGRPDLRAVVVCSDVALPGRAATDAVRLEIEPAQGEPELVTVVYRHTGEGPEVVACERERVAGKRSGVRRRFFPA